jgi:hypothetical protein
LKDRVVLVSLLAASACIHFDRDAGAPGLADVARSPDAPSLRLVEPARPPGEDLFVLSPGAFMLYGARDLGRGAHRTGSYGAELSAEWGSSTENHRGNGDEFASSWQRGLVVPQRAWGLTLSAQFYEGPKAGPISLELRRRWAELAVVGVGPLYQPSTRSPGLVASVQWAVFLVRAGYASGGGFVHAGLDLFYPLTWVRTR